MVSMEGRGERAAAQQQQVAKRRTQGSRQEWLGRGVRESSASVNGYYESYGHDNYVASSYT